MTGPAKTIVTKQSLAQQRLERLVAAAKNGKLIVIVGAGVSVGLTNGEMPSWVQLVKNGFEYAAEKERISKDQALAWKHQYTSHDIDDLLSAAEFITKKLGGPNDLLYARWLQETVGAQKPKNLELIAGLQQLVKVGAPICTLNYDLLLEEALNLQPIQVSQTDKVAAWMRREQKGILHLHGIWTEPDTCILGIRDYERTLGDEVRDLFQRSLAVFNHLLFIGCGDTFADPNFSSLLGWLRTKFGVLTPQHFALTLEAEVAGRAADPAWSAFVDPISYGTNYSDLAPFLLNQFGFVKSAKARKKRESPVDHSDVLETYRNFLVRDCGQMTIEGVSADMDTGQRRFDLEKLFVPLKVSPCPPDFKASDPNRSEKIARWQKENSKNLPFGQVLQKGGSLALLALPGGGKTLLLKRVAVAYAQPSRRQASNDDLPNLDLFPILIRCREWRDHIRLPIRTLLSNIGKITGQAELTGFSEAILPLLRQGKVLLLIDGLDEIHNDADRMIFVDHLESFLEEFKKVRMIVTSREAGFGLVAPSLARFCERWRLAPLESDAIESLCTHWHRLMTGETPAAIEEGKEVSSTILRNNALRRLAENPLLLTMLLVVKNGAGGLPPDRVTLYGRAVGVLLDTWNIRGHEPLNPREAVPQLSFIAFRLMQEGKQTATERELLVLLEEARENLPHIRRYAKDSPHDFLKRVELRSSLLLEAGHQVESGSTVPFYQFRHLTFQEYLAAVAVTEGHYLNYAQTDTVLSPLSEVLILDEWKEVIPMVAVLARKQAEPLLFSLVQAAQLFRAKVEAGDPTARYDAWELDQTKLPPIISRLVQCLAEEAEATPTTLTAALSHIAYFAKGCLSKDDWPTLSHGPYAEDLYIHAWTMFAEMKWPQECWLMNTCASLAYRNHEGLWNSAASLLDLSRLFDSVKREDVSKAVLICMGRIWHAKEDLDITQFPLQRITEQIFSDDPTIWGPAVWSWTNLRRRDPEALPVTTEILDKLLNHWLGENAFPFKDTVSYALSCQLGMPREDWSPKLTREKQAMIRKLLNNEDELEFEAATHHDRAKFFIAYHSRSAADSTLRRKVMLLEDLDENVRSSSPIARIEEKLNKI